MTGGDPRKLYETCQANEISMCGVVPAVTIMQALQKKTPEIKPEVVDYTTSAKASGDASRVVGYAGVVIE
jgi:AmmeMemoRadiSam system protein B